MRVAIASESGMLVDQHFGHATQFLVCEPTPSGFRLIEVRRNEPACGAEWTAGTTDPMQRSADLVADCQVVVAAKIGECGVGRLAEHGIEAFEMTGLIETALQRLAHDGWFRPVTPAPAAEQKQAA